MKETSSSSRPRGLASFVVAILFCSTIDTTCHGRDAGNRRDHQQWRTIVPIPSAPQLRYQSTDFVALIHFNMATFARDGDPGCASDNWNDHAPYAVGPTSDPTTFQPRLLNTTQWFDSITGLGAKIAILTAKHGCGFCLWPTRSKMPDGTPYGYHASDDVLGQFVQSANAAGVGYGFYYSILKNFKLCRVWNENSCLETILPGQVNLTHEEFRSVVEQQVTELWTGYGELAEIWVDSNLAGFGDLMVRLQPNAAGSPAHPRAWCGTESGYPSRDVGPGPIWQTGPGEFGNESSPLWVDKFCDPQLFRDHVWFWEPNLEVRTLSQMIPIYHDIVGRGMIMELAFSIDRNGLVDPKHEVVYKQLGKWVEDCYGSPVVSTSGRGSRLMVTIPKGTTFDRIQLEEDIALGQRIRAYTVEVINVSAVARTALADNSLTGWHDVSDERHFLVTDGNAVGRKRIHLLHSVFYAHEEGQRIHRNATNQESRVVRSVLHRKRRSYNYSTCAYRGGQLQMTPIIIFHRTTRAVCKNLTIVSHELFTICFYVICRMTHVLGCNHEVAITVNHMTSGHFLFNQAAIAHVHSTPVLLTASLFEPMRQRNVSRSVSNVELNIIAHYC
jgi:alpha-L-fucosidase